MKTQDQFLQRTSVALTNAQSTPELIAALEKYTYNLTRIREGMRLHDTIEDLTRHQERAQEVQYKTTQLLQEAKNELIALFNSHASTARRAYQHEADYQDTLHLATEAPHETTACLDHIQRFYAYVPAAMMEKYHVTQKELSEGKRLALRVQELIALRTKLKSQPQQLTQARQQAIAELRTWMRRFDKVAKIAFDDQPQQLETLGLVVRV